jgi:hypothetical protein
VGSYTDKLRGKASEVMESDEQLLAAIRTMPRGTVMSTGIGGAVGAAVAGKQAKKAQAGQGEGTAAADWPAMRSAVGLTNRRLLIYDYTMMGKPKDLVAQFPLDQIASLDLEKGVTNRFRFNFADGSAAQVECAKLEKVGDFKSAFESARTGAT